MAPVIRGAEAQARHKRTNSIEAASGGTGWLDFHFYTANFQPGENLIDDDELGGTRHNLVDPTQQVKDLPNPSGSMQVAADRNQLGFWLSSLWGPPTTDATDDPVFEHVWTSGITAPGLVHIELPLAATLVNMADSQAVSQMVLGLGDEGGFRKADLTFVGRSVRRLGSAVASSPTAAPARDKLAATAGVVKINGSNFANILGGSMTMSNGAFFERYMDDSQWPSAVEIGRPSFQMAPQLRIRSDAATMLALFDGVTPFTLEVLYQTSADQLLKFYAPQVVAPPVLPTPNGVGVMDVSPTFMASQTASAPMLTTTIRNTIADYAWPA